MFKGQRKHQMRPDRVIFIFVLTIKKQNFKKIRSRHKEASVLLCAGLSWLSVALRPQKP